MRNLTITPGRRFPRRKSYVEGGEVEDRLRDLERIVDALQRQIRELDQSAGGDIRDRATVLSKGPGKEVSVPHRMRLPPTDYRLLNQKGGDGTIRPSRSNLADARFAYFVTTADKGVKFKVEFLVLDDDDKPTKVTPAETYISDEKAQAASTGV